MKKKIMSIVIGVIVILLVVISVLFFRTGNPFSGLMSKNNDSAYMPHANENVPAQQGKPDEASKKLVKILKESTGEDIDPKNVVSTGKKVMEGNFSYKVDSWSVQKEYPGYQLPEGIESLDKFPGAKVDAQGNIVNGFSYVVVNTEVGNLEDKEVTDLVWGNIKLEIPGVGSDQYTGSLNYLGENAPRQYNGNYLKELFKAKETKKMPLIFVVKDQLIKGKQLYLEINSSGSPTVDPDYDVRRYIVLN